VSFDAIRHVTILGRVQGVGYRAWTADEARTRHLQGWVRNRRDGSVEAVFAGDAEFVDAMIAACRKGPSMARVEAVDVNDATADELALRGSATFAMLPTL
jgi:acylphosphatase